MGESVFLTAEGTCVTKNVAFHVMTSSEILDMAGSNIPDTVGRKTRRRRRTQAIAKRCAFHANAITVYDCVPLTISYHLYFLRISKVWSMLYLGSVGRVQRKQYISLFTYTFLECSYCFSSKNLCFCHFYFFF